MGILKKITDKYELTKSISITDVKGYLQKEYDRAFEREDLIKQQEQKIKELNKIEIKYNALLVVQENTQKRIERQDERIKELKKSIDEYEKEIKLMQAKQYDIKQNAENKLQEKDMIIKELRKEVKKYEKISQKEILKEMQKDIKKKTKKEKGDK